MNKIRQYFSTLEITRGFFIALLGAAFIYLEYWKLSYPFVETLFALLFFYFLLQAHIKVWFFTGFFTGLFWFWWITVSFKTYEMNWAIPIGLLVITLSYAGLFYFIAYFGSWYKPKNIINDRPTLHALLIKSIGLLLLSYIHPFGFDWFKPELIFIHSYLGIEKWQFALILGAITLSIWRQQFLYLFFILFAYQSPLTCVRDTPKNIQIVTTYTSVEDKWNKKLQAVHFKAIFNTIDTAITDHKTLIIFPESIFPLFLNRTLSLLNKLKVRSQKISIVTGALYWDGETPHNSAYIFTKGSVKIANKVLLVPFGESNPLPDFLSDWVNKVFYDDAVDYKASDKVVDYVIDDVTYRNAICFEATSEKLYTKNKEGKRPQKMIVLSNNGWFSPSIEPTLQKLLLQYYSKKYGTVIYHSINMSPSYIIQDK